MTDTVFAHQPATDTEQYGATRWCYDLTIKETYKGKETIKYNYRFAREEDALDVFRAHIASYQFLAARGLVDPINSPVVGVAHGTKAIEWFACVFPQSGARLDATVTAGRFYLPDTRFYQGHIPSLSHTCLPPVTESYKVYPHGSSPRRYLLHAPRFFKRSDGPGYLVVRETTSTFDAPRVSGLSVTEISVSQFANTVEDAVRLVEEGAAANRALNEWRIWEEVSKNYVSDLPKPKTLPEVRAEAAKLAVGAWADTTFPECSSLTIIRHLEREMAELHADVLKARRYGTGTGFTVEMIETSFRMPAFPDDRRRIAEEAADCLMLLLHLAHRERFSLYDAAREKFARNQAREWGPPDEFGVSEHVRDAGTATADRPVPGVPPAQTPAT